MCTTVFVSTGVAEPYVVSVFGQDESWRIFFRVYYEGIGRISETVKHEHSWLRYFLDGSILVFKRCIRMVLVQPEHRVDIAILGHNSMPLHLIAFLDTYFLKAAERVFW